MIKYRSVKLAALAAALLCSALAGCVSSHVLVGKARPAITPDQVKVYLHAPPKYEEIAILESSSRASWTVSAQGKTDKVIERLKIEAARLGANGILLQEITEQPVGSFGIGVGNGTISEHSATGIGVGGSTAITQKSGSGLAIYVVPEGEAKP